MECKIVLIPIACAYYHDLVTAPRVEGKSMLARRLTTILPAVKPAEALETTRLRRVARCVGLTTPARPMGASTCGPAPESRST
jgi:predicted ATPase with chaperone activity